MPLTYLKLKIVAIVPKLGKFGNFYSICNHLIQKLRYKHVTTKIKNLIDMTKTLKVTDPFLRLDFGDTFVQNEDGDYVSSVREDFTDNTEDGKVFSSKYHADFIISKDYASQLISDGYLEEVQDKRDFVNIFDEIDKLIKQYEEEQNEVDETMHPAIKHEREVVMSNLLTVLNHLKSLKK